MEPMLIESFLLSIPSLGGIYGNISLTHLIQSPFSVVLYALYFQVCKTLSSKKSVDIFDIKPA